MRSDDYFRFIQFLFLLKADAYFTSIGSRFPIIVNHRIENVSSISKASLFHLQRQLLSLNWICVCVWLFVCKIHLLHQYFLIHNFIAGCVYLKLEWFYSQSKPYTQNIRWTCHFLLDFCFFFFLLFISISLYKLKELGVCVCVSVCWSTHWCGLYTR